MQNRTIRKATEEANLDGYPPADGYPITARIGGRFALARVYPVFLFGLTILNETLLGRIPVFPHRFAGAAHTGGRAYEA